MNQLDQLQQQQQQIQMQSQAGARDAMQRDLPLQTSVPTDPNRAALFMGGVDGKFVTGSDIPPAPTSVFTGRSAEDYLSDNIAHERGEHTHPVVHERKPGTNLKLAMLLDLEREALMPLYTVSQFFILLFKAMMMRDYPPGYSAWGALFLLGLLYSGLKARHFYCSRGNATEDAMDLGVSLILGAGAVFILGFFMREQDVVLFVEFFMAALYLAVLVLTSLLATTTLLGAPPDEIDEDGSGVKQQSRVGKVLLGISSLLLSFVVLFLVYGSGTVETSDVSCGVVDARGVDTLPYRCVRLTKS